MKIIFTDHVKLSCHRTHGRWAGWQEFRTGDICNVEFLGEDQHLDYISFELEGDLQAINVPRTVVAVLER